MQITSQSVWLARAGKYVFSANGAPSLRAWGIVPGLWTKSSNSAEGAIQGSGMNCAFSARVWFHTNPWGVAPAFGISRSWSPLNLRRGRSNIVEIKQIFENFLGIVFSL